MPTVVESEKSPGAWTPPVTRLLDEAVWQACGFALAAFLVVGVMPAAAWAGDLSKYRNFEFGADLSTVTRLTGMDASQVKVIHRRPALIQELEWRPQPLGASSAPEADKEVTFSFYDGKLFRIAVDYDRYATEGLTAGDFANAISATYGPSVKLAAPVAIAPASYGDQEEIVAQWQDSQYRFDLVRSSYGPAFRLVGVQKSLEASAQAATLEAKRLDDLEAPQRDAARLVSEEEAANVRSEKARLVNKPKFRP